MRVVSNKALVAFAARHPAASAPLQAWRRIIEHNAFTNYADLKKAFNATDRARSFYTLDISGNTYRIVAAIHFNTQMLFVRRVFAQGV